MKSIIHVNQHLIKSNLKNNTNHPTITVKQNSSTIYAWGINLLGPSKLEYHKDNPLSCGARVYIVTNHPIELLDQNNQIFEGMKYSEIKK